MTWVLAASVEEIPKRGARVLHVGSVSVAIFRTSSNEVYALQDKCPHKAGPLSQGIVHGACVTCPLHDWVIDLKTGNATGPDEGNTRTFSVHVDNGNVFIDVSSLATTEIPANELVAAVAT